EALAVTDEAQAHATLVQGADLAFQRAEEQLHQRVDFLFRPAPVLAGEGEQGQRADAVREAEVDRALGRARTGTVADDARAAPALRPAPVAIHDDGQVAGDRWAGRCCHEGHAVGRPLRPPSVPVPWP